MESQMSFNEDRHETIQGTSAGSHELKYLFAVTLSAQSPFNCLDLSPDAANSCELLLQVLRSVRQRSSPL